MYAKPDLNNARPLSVADFARMKAAAEPIACLTAYDASFAAAEDRAGVDIVLVGDSLGMVVQGLESTVPVTVDDIIYHCRAVARGLRRGFMMADMPFLSYAILDDAVTHAARLMQEGGAKMVKLEGSALQAEIVEHLSSRGVPVCAHLGLRPQSIHKLGGFKVQGRDDAAAAEMRHDAEVLVAAGADMLLLECVPAPLAAEITAASKVPVIGIGAGASVDGQILVMHDMLGMHPGQRDAEVRLPRFVQEFMTDNESIDAAFFAYVRAVKEGSYPDSAHSFGS